MPPEAILEAPKTVEAAANADLLNAQIFAELHHHLTAALAEHKAGVQGKVTFTHSTEHLAEERIAHADLLHPDSRAQILQTVEQLLIDLETTDLAVAYRFLASLKGKTDHLADYFAGVQPEHHASAREFSEQLFALQCRLRQQIIVSFEIGDRDPSHDAVLQHATDAERYDSLHDLHASHAAQASRLHDRLAESHGAGRDQFLPNFAPTTAEEIDRLANYSVDLQQALGVIAQAFRGTPNWAVIGSAAAFVAYDHPKVHIDDIDISFQLRDFDAVLVSFKKLAEAGLLTLDPDYGRETNTFGRSRIISGQIGGVAFEAFAEAPNAGLARLGSVERTVRTADLAGESLHLLDQEGLRDQYVFNLLQEFSAENLESYRADGLKAKYLMRLAKLNNIGCSVLEGIIAAIRETQQRFSGEQGAGLQSILARSRQVIQLLESARADFAERSQNDSSTVEPPAAVAELLDYNIFFTVIQDFKFSLAEQCQRFDSAKDAATIGQIHEQVHEQAARLALLESYTLASPAGMDLHYFALQRLKASFLAPLYKKMAHEVLSGGFARSLAQVPLKSFAYSNGDFPPDLRNQFRLSQSPQANPGFALAA